MAITNIFDERKSKYGKEVQQVYDDLIAELDGPDGTTAMQRILAQRAAVLTVLLRRMEALVLTEDAVDLDLYAKTSSSLARMLRTLRDRALAPEKIERDATSQLEKYLGQVGPQKRVRLVRMK